MENAISSFDLEVIAKKHQIRIWVCRRIGKRWAFLVGAGETLPLPSELIYETENLGFFIQGENFFREQILEEIKTIIHPSLLV
jgi:hypothetical protein